MSETTQKVYRQHVAPPLLQANAEAEARRRARAEGYRVMTTAKVRAVEGEPNTWDVTLAIRPAEVER